jgi:ribosomal protein L29
MLLELYMKTSYEKDVVAWATEQAELIRTGRFEQLDLTHIAEEIEDVGKSEQRELAQRMSILLMHLLKWEFQSSHRRSSWASTIREQRKSITRRLEKTSSLNRSLTDDDWLADVWLEARNDVTKETGIEFDKFAEFCPWDMADVLQEDWLPGGPEQSSETFLRHGPK